MIETGFAEAEDAYIHIICQAEHRGLCGMTQDEIVWYAKPCSVCLLVQEMQEPNTCPLRGGICTCNTKGNP